LLFVLTRRFCFVLPPEPGDRKGRGGWARPAALIPWPRGPEAPRPRAHPTALWSLVGCGAGRFGVGAQRTCCSALPCASGRGHSLHNARKRRPGARDTRAPDVRPRPPSRQSRGSWAIHRFSRSAMPFLFPPFCPDAGGEPRSPQRRSIWSAGLLQPGVFPPLSPGPTGSGMVFASPTDRGTTVIVRSSCRRSRAGSDKEVTRS
jgi:hypothetical protein